MLSLYTAINLSSLVKEEVSRIESAISADISDTHTYTCDPNAKIDLWDTVPSHFSNYSMPLLFIINSFTQLGENKTWRSFRNTENDIVCDASGNISAFDDVFQKAEEFERKLRGTETDFFS